MTDTNAGTELAEVILMTADAALLSEAVTAAEADGTVAIRTTETLSSGAAFPHNRGTP